MFALFSHVSLDKELKSDALYPEKEQGNVFVRRNQMKQKRSKGEFQSGL